MTDLRPAFITCLACVAFLPVAPLAVATERPALVAEVTNCGGDRCSWRATILVDGTLMYENFGAPAKGGRRTLTRAEFNQFRAAYDRERPWEINGTLGDLTIHGPQRRVRVGRGGRQSSFQLMTTPVGLDSLYRSDSSQIARALRFCQAAYTLLDDVELPDCVDERP